MFLLAIILAMIPIKIVKLMRTLSNRYIQQCKYLDHNRSHQHHHHLLINRCILIASTNIIPTSIITHLTQNSRTTNSINNNKNNNNNSQISSNTCPKRATHMSTCLYNYLLIHQSIVRGSSRNQ